MWRKYLALALASLMLPACAACGGAPEPEPEPFASARRILTHEDLVYDREHKPVVAPGEVLVRFTCMDTFDEEAWRAGTIIQIAWVIEAITSDIEITGLALRNTDGGNVSKYLTHREDYGFGVAVGETWMLPQEEFTAAFHALMAAAQAAEPKEFWLSPNNYSGILNPVYDTGTSFRIASYLPEQLRPNAEAIHMSTALMREYFPFLGTGL